jgi:hypothetical protein
MISDKDSKIFRIIQDYSNYFTDEYVEIVDGYQFNQMDRVKKNHLYYAGKFISNQDPNDVFFNIVKAPCKNETKNIDLDTKDVNVISDDVGASFKCLLLTIELRRYLDRYNIGQLFNKFSDDLPKQGSVVAKKIGGKGIFAKVPIKNLKNDPQAECLKDSWVIEEHYYTPSELSKMNWDKEKIKEAIKSYNSTGMQNYVEDRSKFVVTNNKSKYILVREFYGEVPESEFGGSEEDFVLARYIVVMPENSGSGLILSQEKISEIEYKECHRDRIDGRWLGVSIPEDLEDLQMLKNQEINYIRDALKLSSLILLQTRDKTIAKNILTDLANGDIIRVQSELNRIDLGDRNISQNSQISNEIQSLLVNLANMPEVTTGATLPSGTSFSLGALINQNANKLFDYIREKMGLFYEDIFNNWVLPSISKNFNKKHVLELLNREEIIALQDDITNYLGKEIIKESLMNGKVPTRQEVELTLNTIRNGLEKEKVIKFDIPEGYFDFDKRISIRFTDEAIDKATKLQSISTFIQMLGSNPALLENPLVKEALILSGLNINIPKQEQPIQEQPVTQPEMQQQEIPQMVNNKQQV